MYAHKGGIVEPEWVVSKENLIKVFGKKGDMKYAKHADAGELKSAKNVGESLLNREDGSGQAPHLSSVMYHDFRDTRRA